MAFQSPFTDSKERVYPEAYISASIAACNKSIVSIKLQVWETAAKRVEHPTIPVDLPPMLELPIDLDLVNDNPLDYAYKLLEASGLYPEAVWNV